MEVLYVLLLTFGLPLLATWILWPRKSFFKRLQSYWEKDPEDRG